MGASDVLQIVSKGLHLRDRVVTFHRPLDVTAPRCRASDSGVFIPAGEPSPANQSSPAKTMLLPRETLCIFLLFLFQGALKKKKTAFIDFYFLCYLKFTGLSDSVIKLSFCRLLFSVVLEHPAMLQVQTLFHMLGVAGGG